MAASLDAAYFERLYLASDDPWNFATSAYEHGKYDETIAFLGGPFRSGLEIGCSIGVLTAMLAPEFDRLLSVDVSDLALSTAAHRCSALTNVRFARYQVPREFPDGRFDAVVVSEVGYYWSDADLATAIDRIAEAAAGGIVELVHFLPKVDDYVRDGDAVHAAFLDDSRFRLIRGMRAERFRIDVLGIVE